MIHKHRFDPIPEQGFIIPGFKQALSVGVDPDGRPAFWYTCNPQQPVRTVFMHCRWTGQQEPDDGTYLGTFTYGNLVYHVWTS